MTPRSAQPASIYRVTIAGHMIAARYVIPTRTFKLPAATIEGARLAGVREAHCIAAIPPWRPCVRRSLEFTTAEAA